MNRTTNLTGFLSTMLLPWLASLALIGASPWAHAGGTQKINDTGAMSCFVNKQLTTNCAGTRQDADFGRDVVMPDDSDGKAGFSFRKVCNNGDFAGTGTCPADPPLGAGPQDWGCTHDRVTKLTWEIKTTDGGVRDTNRRFTNFGDGRAHDTSEYVALVNQQGLCGRTDWRLPTTTQVLSIADYNVPTYSMTSWFPNIARGHWSSEVVFDSNKRYWWLVANGRVEKEKPTYELPVMLVRGGIADIVPEQRFVKTGDEIQDRQTGLVWMFCNEKYADCNYEPADLRFSMALKITASVAKSTGKPWRLPNIKELKSIMFLNLRDISYYPAFFGMDAKFMSATPVPDSYEVRFFSADFRYGGIAEVTNADWRADDLNYMILVRGAD